MAEAQPNPAAPAPADDIDLQTLHVRLLGVERRQALVEAEVGPGPFTGGRIPSALDFLSQYRGSPGFVVDEPTARDTPCLCYELDGQGKGHELCFSKGIVGALDAEQKVLFCPTTERLEPTPRQRERLEAFQHASSSCKTQVEDVPHGERIEPFLACLHAELKERGHQL